MRITLLVIAGLALIAFLAVSVVIPQMVGAEAKDAAQVLVDGAAAAEQQVAANAGKTGKLAGSGKDVKLASKTDPKHGELKWIVSENGQVRAYNAQNAIEITFTPSLQGKTVSWTCRGYPNNAMPASCGGR